MLKARKLREETDPYILDFLSKCDLAKNLNQATHIHLIERDHGLEPGLYEYAPGGLIKDMDGDYVSQLNARQLISLGLNKKMFTHQPTLDMQLVKNNENNV